MPDAAVNSQITDSVSQVNTKVLGDAPAIAMGNLFTATSQALANAAHNATNNQQQAYVTAQAATTEAIATMLSIDTAVTSELAAKALEKPGAEAVATGPALATTATTATTESAPIPAAAQDLSGAAHVVAKASPDPMLTLMVLDAGALTMLDAVAHLQRVSVVTEAATAQALTRALAEPNGQIWQDVIQAASDSLFEAREHFFAVCRTAIDLSRLARGL